LKKQPQKDPDAEAFFEKRKAGASTPKPGVKPLKEPAPAEQSVINPRVQSKLLKVPPKKAAPDNGVPAKPKTVVINQSPKKPARKTSLAKPTTVSVKEMPEPIKLNEPVPEVPSKVNTGQEGSPSPHMKGVAAALERSEDKKPQVPAVTPPPIKTLSLPKQSHAQSLPTPRSPESPTSLNVTPPAQPHVEKKFEHNIQRTTLCELSAQICDQVLRFTNRIKKKPMKIKDLVKELRLDDESRSQDGLKKNHWVQAYKGTKWQGSSVNGLPRKSGEWGVITRIPEEFENNGKVEVLWKGGRDGLTECEIVDYCQSDPEKNSVDGIYKLGVPMRLKKLHGKLELKKGDRVQAGPRQSKTSWCAKVREGGEWGTIRDIQGDKVRVLWEGKKHEDWSNCEIMAYRDPSWPTRRRMATREHSKRRDSPVMLRLLEKIIAAQD